MTSIQVIAALGLFFGGLAIGAVGLSFWWVRTMTTNRAARIGHVKALMAYMQDGDRIDILTDSSCDLCKAPLLNGRPRASRLEIIPDLSRD